MARIKLSPSIERVQALIKSANLLRTLHRDSTEYSLELTAKLGPTEPTPFIALWFIEFAQLCRNGEWQLRHILEELVATGSAEVPQTLRFIEAPPVSSDPLLDFAVNAYNKNQQLIAEALSKRPPTKARPLLVN